MDMKPHLDEDSADVFIRILVLIVCPFFGAEETICPCPPGLPNSSENKSEVQRVSV